jgi:hypothetical protein
MKPSLKSHDLSKEPPLVLYKGRHRYEVVQQEPRDKQIALATVTTTGVQAATAHRLSRQRGYLWCPVI